MSLQQERFEAKYRELWEDFEATLTALEKRGKPEDLAQFPARYRQITSHLALARKRNYTMGMISKLNNLAVRGHSILYGARVGQWDRILEYALGGFPAQIRREWRYFLAAFLFFMVPWIGVYIWIQFSPDWALHILGPGTLGEMENMYTDSSPSRREAGSDVLMFGFYIANNVGIALRTFGSGILFGIGSLFILAFNGLFIGAIASHLAHVGYVQNLYAFAIAHGSLELTAIVIAGHAGLKVGLAPLFPGRRRRWEALRHAAKKSVGLIAGFSLMLFLAAAVEAFWSPRDFPHDVKFMVGGVMWILVIAYFLLAGRHHAAG